MAIRIFQESGKPVAANVAGLEAAPEAQQAAVAVNVEATAREVVTELQRAQLVEQMLVHRADGEPEADAELQRLQQHPHFHREFLHLA